MAYPGNTELSPQAKDRVMTAFKQVVGKLQQGNREEALIGLEFVLRLDPAYAPAINLHQQLSSGAGEININEIVSQLQAPTTETINNLLVEAVEDFNNRDFEGARSKVEQVLLDLPGHEEGRNLLGQIEAATKGESQVGQFLAQAREALTQGDSQEAANFVMMAQALDPHHHDIAATIAEIEKGSDMSGSQEGIVPETVAGEEVSFAATDEAVPDFAATAEDAELFTTAPDQEASAEVGNDSPASHPEPGIASEESATPDLSGGEPPPISGEPYYEDAADDVTDFSGAGPETLADDGGPVEVDSNDTHAAIRDLLTEGGTAAAADDFVTAIDAWSRVFLIDPNHEEAKDRIEHIRHAKEDLERRIEPMLTDAEASHESGDVDLARNFVDRVLALYPNHVDATRLKEAIERNVHPDAEAGAAPGMPELEDELFSDEFAPIADFGAEVGKTKVLPEGEERIPEKPKRRFPWQWWATISVAGLLIVAGALWLGGVFVPEDLGEARIIAVQKILADAEEMFNQDRVEEAIVLLEQNSANDDSQLQIDRRLERYRKAITTPVPTAIPQGLSISRDLFTEGRWMAAYERLMAELKAYPNDPGLEELRLEILEAEPEAANLHAALEAGDRRATLSITKDLLDVRPDDQEVVVFYDRELFNASMAELRAFNLSGAEGYLIELAVHQPDDQEVQRILQFIDTYKGRPVDMQLKIFVRSLADR
jgi:tetratricopeptide (TPR) repeat protein